MFLSFFSKHPTRHDYFTWIAEVVKQRGYFENCNRQGNSAISSRIGSGRASYGKSVFLRLR
jgi:hypothetical protein